MTSAAIRFTLISMKNDNRLIIIGADGFIGSSITSYFRQSGWNIHATVFNRPPSEEEFTLDITSPEDFNSLPRGIPLINTAGLPDQSAPASLMRKVQVGGMKNLVNWALKANCPHLIQLSSISVYGNATVGIGRTEAATLRRGWNPITAALAYGRTKARAEALLEKSGIPFSAPRLPAVYGPGDSFFSGQIRRLLKNSGRPLPPGGKKPVSIIAVDQVGPLMESILNYGPMNAALNAVGAHIPWKTILEAYAESWDLPLRFDTRNRIRDYLNFADPGRQMAAYYAAFGADFPDDKLRETLGWQPCGDWRRYICEAAAEVN
ncbi:MAG: hypothetical protein DRZ90_10795 [Spirochaetes bacterium]|nr:MAG: hypothetical protein DRZ90_10795 [Spirochaetota bacterium]